MPLLVFDKRPVVIVILDYFIFRRVVRFFRDPPSKFGMIGVDTRVYDRDRNPASAIIRPGVAYIQIIDVILKVIVSVADRVVRRRSVMYFVALLVGYRCRLHLIVDRHFIQILAVAVVLVNVRYRNAVGKRKRCESAVFYKTQFCA